MVAYEFYLIDPIKGHQLFGVLPERRKNPARITQKSIINWARIFLGNKLDIGEIIFVEVTLEESKGGIFQSTPPFTT